MPPVAQGANAMITHGHVHVSKVWGIPQFWLVWMVLCMNVSAGIGVIGMASPMLQEVFGGALIGIDAKFGELDKAQLTAIAGVAAGFTALLSLFNIGGRFVWASFSDKLGRKMTYIVFFVLGGLLYASIPASAGAGSKMLFVSAFCVILSMYGACVLGRLVWHANGGCESRSFADCLGNRRYLGPRGGQLHARLPVGLRSATRAGLQPNHVHLGGHVGDWPDLQFVDQTSGRQTLHDR
jgi:hypothetical protein